MVVCTTLKLLDINQGIAIGIPLKNRLGGKACLPHFLRQIGNVFSLFRNGLVKEMKSWILSIQFGQQNLMADDHMLHLIAEGLAWGGGLQVFKYSFGCSIRTTWYGLRNCFCFKESADTLYFNLISADVSFFFLNFTDFRLWFGKMAPKSMVSAFNCSNRNRVIN